MAKLKTLRVPFTMVPNSLICDKELTATAKALWIYMQSKPADWDFSMKRVADDFKEGRKAMLSAVKLLKKNGWVEYKKLPTGRSVYELKVPSGNKAKVPSGHHAFRGPISNKEKEKIKNSFSDENAPLVEKRPANNVSGKKTKEKSTTVLLVNHFNQLIEKEIGVTPVTPPARANSMVKMAKNYLTDEQIKDLFEWQMGKPIPDHDKMQITQALSTYNISKYKVEHGIK